MARINITAGERFTRLTVVREAKKRQGGLRALLVRCDCGAEKIVNLQDLRSGKVKSCGCLRREHSTVHGAQAQDAPPLLRKMIAAYFDMHARCKYPSNPSFKNYGGRGVKVCERWSGEGGFARFLADMGERPEGLTLDRRDVNGDYSPDNCQWATALVQRHNQRRELAEAW